MRTALVWMTISALTPVAIAEAQSISADATGVVFTNTLATYSVSANGRSESLRNNATGEELLVPRPFKPAFAVYRSGATFRESQSIEYHRSSTTEGTLVVRFGLGVEMTLRCRAIPSHFLFELLDIRPDTGTDSIHVVRLEIAGNHPSDIIGAVYSGDFMVNEMALRLETEVSAFPFKTRFGENSFLDARAHSLVSLRGVKVALSIQPVKRWLRFAKHMEREYGLPHPTIDEVWAKKHPDVKSSYLFVDITKENHEDVIAFARRGGFKYIMIYSGTWSSSVGSYEINRLSFPGGLADLRHVVNRVHDAGLKFGFHTLTPAICKCDRRYVRPVPDARLAKESPVPLAASISAEEDEIPLAAISDPTVNDCFSGDVVKDYECYFDRGETDIIIENEILRCTGVDRAANKLICPGRGAWGTARSTHQVGVTVNHLAEHGNWYLPDLNSTLLEEIVANLAGTYRAVGGEMLFLDGILGAARAVSPAPDRPLHFYTGSRVAESFFGQIGNDTVYESASGVVTSSYEWHVLSRGNSADFAFIGVEPYMDKTKIGTFEGLYRNALLPQELGWIGFKARTGLDFEDSYASTTRDEIEYQLNRALAHDLPIGLETTHADLTANRATGDILDLIRTYERLRLDRYFRPRFLEPLTQPDRAFVDTYHLKKEQHRLVRKHGVYGFRRQAYSERYVANGAGETWEVQNPFGPQRLNVKITALPPLAPDGGVDNVALETFSGSGSSGFETKSGPNTICKLAADGSIDATFGGESGTTGWCRFTKDLAPPGNLSQHKALGVRVAGDAKGEVVSFEITDNRSFSRHYMLRVDFNDTRVQELALPTTQELEPGLIGLFSLVRFDFGRVGRLTIHVRNIRSSVNLRLGPIEALHQDLAHETVQPSLTVNGRTVSFPTRLAPHDPSGPIEPGEYLVYDGERYSKYDGNHELLETGFPERTGARPRLRKGRNTLVYRSIDSSSGHFSKALLTLVTESKPRLAR